MKRTTFILVVALFGLVLSGQDAEKEKDPAGIPAIWPVNGYVENGFGDQVRLADGSVGPNPGIDIETSVGREIKAPADGLVLSLEKVGDRGWLLVIDHRSGYLTRYSWQGEALVKPGEELRRWQALGRIQEPPPVAYSTLRYQVEYNGQLIDPLKLIYK